MRLVVAWVTSISLTVASVPAQALAGTQQPSDADIAKAKGLYMQAEELVGQGKHQEAIPLYEEAYQLVPGKHGFAYKVGVSAYKVGDCAKAKEYFNHLVTYGADQAKLADKVKEARTIMGKIEASKCDQPKKGATPAQGGPATELAEEENPFAIEQKKAEQAAALEKDPVQVAKRNEARNKRVEKGMLSYGMLGIGGAMAITGGVLLMLARRDGNTLGALSQPSDALGFFPEGDFACRDQGADCPYDLDRRMRRFNLFGYGLIGAGVLVLGTGTYFWLAQRKGKSNPKAEPKKLSRRLRVGPQWRPRGAGAVAHLRF